MATPPFENTRLKPGEWPDQSSLEEKLEALTRNIEDLYGKFPISSENLQLSNNGNVRSNEKLRIVQGVFNTAGEIREGSGFSLTATGVGTVTVTFSPAFFQIPSVVCMPGETAAPLAVKNFETATTKSAAKFVLFNTTTGAATAGVINLIAIGLRS